MPQPLIPPKDYVFELTTYKNDGCLMDPYRDSPKGTRTVRLSADVPQDVFDRLSSILPFRGSKQAIINTLLYGILEQLKSAGITHYDPSHRPAILAIIKGNAFGTSTLAPLPTVASVRTAPLEGG